MTRKSRDTCARPFVFVAFVACCSAFLGGLANDAPAQSQVETPEQLQLEVPEILTDRGSIRQLEDLGVNSTTIIDPANIEPLIAPGDPLLQPQFPAFELPNITLELVDFRDQELGEAMRLFSEQSGLNIAASTQANQMKINLFLHNVRALDVLENLTKTHDLYYRVDEKSGIIRIYTTDEYEENLASFRDETTRVFTLLYPNPVDAAVAISDLFGERVKLNFGVGDQDSILDLVYRLNRFDLVDSRSLGLGSYRGDYAYGGRQFSRLNGLGGFTGNQANLANQVNAQDEMSPLSDLSSDQIQELINALDERTGQQNGVPENSKDPIAKLLKERQATIYVTVVRRNNQVVVRTGDEATMKQIETLIQSLDVPTPLVLLEVKVMSVLLDDRFRSAFDYQFSDGTTAGSFTTGDILPPPSDLFTGQAQRFASMLPGGSVLNRGDLTFQYVSETFRARMQLLEDDNRVTVLNTPLLLTANKEVSRIFIGDTIPFTVGFTAAQVIPGGGSGNTIVAGTPITELRDVGQSLLITPSINADRTVTLRVVQENARVVPNGGSILVQDDQGGFTPEDVDTVNRSTVSGTVVAKDGLAVALGGLIEDEVSDNREQVPVVGKLPVFGFFFRRQATGRARRELIVMIRPYVFNTPTESALMSQDLLKQLSVHPQILEGDGAVDTFCADDVIRAELDCCNLHDKFRFHNVVPKTY